MKTNTTLPSGHSISNTEFPSRQSATQSAPISSDNLTHSGQASSTQLTAGEIHVVPKGLRSFDVEDADFFLELLPGPRGSNGLPESISFWKTRLNLYNVRRQHS